MTSPRVTVAATFMAFSLGIAHAAQAEPISVGSKVDTEGALLGNMILLMLEDHGVETEDNIQLGTTSTVREALLSGALDVYPEYTGNGAFFFDMADEPLWNDAETAFETVRDLDLDANALVWLQPAPANNTWAIAVRRDLADAEGLETLEDLGSYVAGGGDIKLAASAEFVETANALPAFQEAYGFELDGDQLLILSGGDTAATIRAAAEQINNTNAAMAYGTDGALSAVGLVTLEDTKGVQMVYQPAPVFRESVIEAHPEIPDLLEPVFLSLDLETLQDLNARIAVEGIPARDVAREYLTDQGHL